jgi:hypothetical protein
MSDAETIRPRDLALLLLASGDTAPRQRARDQQADRAGLDLRRCVLTEVAALDPEPEELEAALFGVVEQMGPPTGPTRSLALAFLEEWRAASETPEWVAHLLDEAVRPRERKGEGRRRDTQLPG